VDFSQIFPIFDTESNVQEVSLVFKSCILKRLIPLLFLFALASCSKEAPEGCLVCYDTCITVNDPFYDGLCLSEFRSNGFWHSNYGSLVHLVFHLQEKGLLASYMDKELPPVCFSSFSDNSDWAEARENLFHSYYYCEEQ